MDEVYNPSAIYFEIGKLEQIDKNYDEAIDTFEKSLSFNRYNNGALLELGRSFLSKGDKLTAKEKFLEIVEDFSDKAAYYELGSLAMDEGNFPLARMYYKKALNIKQNDIMSWFNLGKLERKDNNPEEAKKCFEKVYQINKRDIYNLLELGQIEKELGNLEKAKKYFESILNIKEDGAAYLELGLIEESLENYDEALKMYHRSLELDENWKINLKLALFEKRLGNFETSKEYLFKALNTNDDNKILFELINIYLKEDNFVDALYYYLKILNNGFDETLDRRHLDRIGNYIRHKLNLLRANNGYEKSLYINQLTNYNEKNAVEVSHSRFSENYDFKKVLKIIKENLTTENFNDTRGGQDHYIIDFDYPVGIADDIETNSIQVITVVNSKKILFMVPTNLKKIRLKEKINKESDNYNWFFLFLLKFRIIPILAIVISKLLPP